MRGSLSVFLVRFGRSSSFTGDRRGVVDVLDTLLAVSLSLIYVLVLSGNLFMFVYNFYIYISDVNRYFHLDFVCIRLKIVFFF